MRREDFYSAHQHVEQALPRGFFLNVAEVLAQDGAVDGFHVRGEDGQRGGKFAAQLRQRHARRFGDFGKTDLLDRFVREQIEKCRNDFFTVARRRAGLTPGGWSRRFACRSTCRSASGFSCHGAILHSALNEARPRPGRGFAFAISLANVGEGGDRSKAANRRRRSGDENQPANSRERAVAAAMASFISRKRPFGRISTASAAAVVPPG